MIILRHGQTVWNREGRMQGRLDSDLTPLGQVQAAHQGALLRGLGTGFAARVSPRGRARRTAALAGLRPIVDDDLAEVSMGTWEGRIRPGGAGQSGVLWKFAAPNGESQAELIERLHRVLSTCHGPTVLITHGVLCIGLRALLTGLAPDEWDSLDDPQGVLHVIEGGQERILR
ncbi:histidine phosphatase family protein [Jannaschia sp. 2305UL9-9]|uniref:histidine phosphatase family protein n=1 Tax=Jannaschia sp. 2305UL9-9 TaxID=3121638 RepID=UPI003529320E